MALRTESENRQILERLIRGDNTVLASDRPILLAPLHGGRSYVELFTGKPWTPDQVRHAKDKGALALRVMRGANKDAKQLINALYEPKN